jgi:hypothetical protein
MPFDTTRLIDQIKLKGALPEGRFDDDEILDVAYDVMLHNVAPWCISNREEYFVYSTTTSITSGQAAYPLPSRSLGMALREVKVIEANRVKDLIRMDLEEIRTTQTGTPREFYIQNNELYLYPTPGSTQHTLQQYYFLRPSKLVPVTEGAVVSAIDTGTNTLTISGPATWTTSNTFDIVQAKSGYKIYSDGMDLTASAVSTSSITLSSLPANIAVGDYVNLAEESCFPFIPTEAHGLLVHATVGELLESIGDREGFTIAEGRVAKIKKDLEALFRKRIQGAPKNLFTPMLR